ncbi:hypothetical protein E8D34_16010 [Nocardioides sp. GY 10113]|uniref:hypothetical protein n=1 Tax=Nocardioides sp. GY 10113 TaxID=2569761 RepID=UPI0010A7D3C0|nr:hypothetical protein [Nocardioides sp. GY 10113]TIC83214.1 hypothetical protein E8D34_16010 [Nocardioides sp. GY 10113]
MNRTRALVGATLGGLLSLVVLAPAPAPRADAVAPLVAAAPDSTSDAASGTYRATRSLERTMVEATGEKTVGSYSMTVSADHTTNLRGRERIRISWTGAPPSGGRASNPYGEKGLAQEYPVVVLQCRGTDDPELPADEQLSRQTCWTSSYFQRSQVLTSPSAALWTVDRYAADADVERLSGLADVPEDACTTVRDSTSFYSHLTPFVAASGAVFPACDRDTMPPEAAVGAAFPAAEVAAFSDADGAGSVDFEVRSAVENESLGCSAEVACSIVVVPIAGLSCGASSDPVGTVDRNCRQYGEFASGSSNFAGLGIDEAVGPALWWSESNWRHRFSIPITFGLAPDACDVLDPRAPVGFSGSELMAQAALQWAPAYCLNRKRFKFQLNQMPDQTGWNLMEKGETAAAFVSGRKDQVGDDPVGYAPTAVTGFAIGYVADRPDNGGEVPRLNLNPRLLAKLLTQSYPGSALGRGHPGLEENPLSLLSDPEFIKLNPGLSQRDTEAAATLLSLSNSSDQVEQLTAYIAADADATAFVDGDADPWGMTVNPSYEGLALPTAEWPLLDTYTPETQDPCRQANPSVYLTQLAAPVTTLRKISDALIDSWPNVQTRCDADLTSVAGWKVGRIDRQSYGARFMLGLVSLGDAERYGLRTASLATAKGTYVAPTQGSLAAAIGISAQADGDDYGPFALDPADVRAARAAYPGTQVVHTAARMTGMEADEAATVASFIRIAVSEGQRVGRDNGDLPEGYLPIVRTGVTAKLWRAAQRVADAVEAQEVPSEPEPDEPAEEEPSATPDPGPATVAPAPPAVEEPAEPTPPATPGEKGRKGKRTPPEETVVATEAASSTTAFAMLPTLLVLGLLAAAASLVTRLVGTRRGGRP